MSNEELVRLYGGSDLTKPTPGSVGAMTDEQLKAAYDAAHPNVVSDIAHTVPSKLGEGSIGVLGLPGMVSDLALRGGNLLRGALGGTPETEAEMASHRLFPTSEELTKKYETATGTQFYEPKTVPGKIVGAGVEQIPGAMVFGGSRPITSAIRYGLEPGMAGEAVGQGMEAIGLDKGTADVGRLVTTVGTGGVAGLKRPRDLAPSRQELDVAAKKAFDVADNAGVAVKQGALQQFVVDTANGLRSRSKIPAVSKELTPKTDAALLALAKAGQAGNLSFSEARNLREVIGAAISEATPGGKDMKTALQIRDRFDQFMEDTSGKNLVLGAGGSMAQKAAVKAWKDARGLYSRARKSEEIQGLMANAKASVNPTTGYFYGDALRQQFKTLVKDKDRMRLFTPAEQHAFRRVANGGPIDYAMRLVAGLSPTSVGGIVRSAAATGGAAYQTGGSKFAMAVPAAGLLGKGASLALARKHAAEADMLIRGGAGSVPRGPVLSGVPLALYYGNMATMPPPDQMTAPPPSQIPRTP